MLGVKFGQELRKVAIRFIRTRYTCLGVVYFVKIRDNKLKW